MHLLLPGPRAASSSARSMGLVQSSAPSVSTRSSWRSRRRLTSDSSQRSPSSSTWSLSKCAMSPPATPWLSAFRGVARPAIRRATGAGESCHHSLMARHPLPVRRLVLPPIRTVTVGIGVSPIQPQGRTSRVADCHRRFGFSPTPEHVCLATSMPLRGMDVHHGRRTWLSPRGDLGGAPDPDTPIMAVLAQSNRFTTGCTATASSALAHGTG